MTIIAFALIAYLAHENRGALSQTISSAQWQWLTLSVISLIAANFGMAIVFSRLTQRFMQKKLPDREIAGSFLLSQVAKYIPGRIWGVAMQASTIRSQGAFGGILAANLELAIINAAMVTGAGIACLIWQHYGALAAAAMLGITFAAGQTLININAIQRVNYFSSRFLPKIFPLKNFLAAQSQAKNIDGGLPQSIGLLIYLSMYCLGWWLLAKGVTRLDSSACMGMVAALSLSYIAGVASMLPAGIGAREGTLVLLAPALNLPHADMATLAIASRAAMVLIDILAAIIGAVLLQEKLMKRGEDV